MRTSSLLLTTILAAALSTPVFAQGSSGGGGTGGGNTDATVSRGETGSTKVAAPKNTGMKTAKKKKAKRM
jgi:hypothetical protein